MKNYNEDGPNWAFLGVIFITIVIWLLIISSIRSCITG